MSTKSYSRKLVGHTSAIEIRASSSAILRRIPTFIPSWVRTQMMANISRSQAMIWTTGVTLLLVTMAWSMTTQSRRGRCILGFLRGNREKNLNSLKRTKMDENWWAKIICLVLQLSRSHKSFLVIGSKNKADELDDIDGKENPKLNVARLVGFSISTGHVRKNMQTGYAKKSLNLFNITTTSCWPADKI